MNVYKEIINFNNNNKTLMIFKINNNHYQIKFNYQKVNSVNKKT